MTLHDGMGGAAGHKPGYVFCHDAAANERRREAMHEISEMMVISRKRPASANAAVSGSNRPASQMKAANTRKPKVTAPPNAASSPHAKRPGFSPSLRLGL